MNKADAYKVILTFNLKDSQANEEIKRSNEKDSFPNMLARQPGFVELELVKVNDSKTMSIQTWETEQDWWRALEAVKQAQETMPEKQQRQSILESRDFVAGHIVRSISPAESDLGT
jgi:heme-degrading monooxygenase HmoA